MNALMQGKCCDSLQNTTGVIQEPLGRTRLKIVEFFVACLKKGNAVCRSAQRFSSFHSSLAPPVEIKHWQKQLITVGEIV